jgi:plastocyanin
MQMAELRRREGRSRAGRRRRPTLRRCGPALVLAAAAVAILQPAAASSAEGPTIEAASSSAGFVWKPSSASIAPGGSVSFKSSSTVVPHGVSWRSGPEAPACSGVPVDEEKTNWSGNCTFAQAGTYAFVCTVHPTEMKGTITVAEGGPPPGEPPPGSPPPEPPAGGPAGQGVKLAARQHGTVVRGSVLVAQEATLRVVLFASRASLLGQGHGGKARVGRLARSGLQAGRTKFAVHLKRTARAALRRAGRLRVTAKVSVTAPQHDALKLSKGVLLHD